jgi:hypothetical protein
VTAVANDDQIRVRGLLFYDAGVYKMVASRITQ